MPSTGQIVPNRPTASDGGPRVAVIAYDGLSAFEYGIALEVFGLPRPELEQWYDLAVIAAEDGPLRGIGGIAITPDGGLDLLQRADVVVVPGWRGPEAPVPEPLAYALREAHARGARVASICTGAFVLAAAGLLDGRPATTHWRYAEALARKHPTVRVDPSILYVADGLVLTSAGSAAGLDLCLHLVREDFGVEVANVVARRLVLPAHRDGAQPQVLHGPVVHARGGRVAPVLDAMRARPHEAWPVHRMADVAGLTRRTFARRFHDATGQTPHAWLAAMRIAYARDLLERTALPLRTVAEASGFESAETFRRALRKTYGACPSALRQARG